MGWNTLTQLTAFLQVPVGVIQALENKFGSFSDRIGSISAIPEQVWRDGVRLADFIVTAAVVADPQQGIAAAPAVTRRLLPVETGQAGMV